MLVIEWQDCLSVGVLEIDIQHKLLFERFNSFLQACESEADQDKVHRLFWFLEAYAVTHFTEEEKLMQASGFPDLPMHRKQHAEFAAEIARIKERLRCEGPSPTLVSSLTTFISDWLTRHISQMDRAIGNHLQRSAP
ncbi:hemerythrin [Geomonas silvestris]|uniref:Hemerythrin n=1 Tax=Geomonas silvestris TaxID=2740184 RepID=A0A6V8MHR1_9BACT|nr:hemerythrin family protein [Geomonas silvestris]GFO59540.1 hemerythrin [Geomonas silvestris]